MTEQEIQQIVKEIKGFDEWMKESAGHIYQSIQELKNDDDIYEVIVTIGMANGKEIELRNHCFESFLAQQYQGDTVFMCDGILFVEYTDYELGDSFRQMRIAPSNICYVDVRTVKINWDGLFKLHNIANNFIFEYGSKRKEMENRADGASTSPDGKVCGGLPSVYVRADGNGKLDEVS